ncbi:MAG: IPT/TIG domain-containing protein [Deltaproteobacteria bacterium]|nr:IPT/TIG domain-containing protein [Deltaproteobacteria bacterium]
MLCPRFTVFRLALPALAIVGLTPDAEAQAPPFRCGPDCTTPGQYVLCNDSFDQTSAIAGTLELTDFLDAGCMTFDPPAGSFQLVAFAALFGSGDQLASLVEVHTERSPISLVPMAKIFETGAAIPFSASPGFSGLFFTTQNLTTAFRLCIKQQIDGFGAGTRPLTFDSDGMQHMSTVFDVSRPNPPNGAWNQPSVANVTGDFVIRAVVRYADQAPWQPGGACSSADAGVSDSGANDAAPVSDGGGPTDGGAPLDGGGTTDGGAPPDGGAGADASALQDAGVAADAGPSVDAGALPAPRIISITPDRGPSTQATGVVVTGEGFLAGLSLKIGAIPTTDRTVPGPTTILATVPQGIAPGTYDVVVQNPDGQAAVLTKGFTVTGAGGDPPPDDSCNCTSARETPESGSWMWGVAMLGLAALRSRRARRPRRFLRRVGR